MHILIIASIHCLLFTGLMERATEAVYPASAGGSENNLNEGGIIKAIPKKVKVITNTRESHMNRAHNEPDELSTWRLLSVLYINKELKS